MSYKQTDMKYKAVLFDLDGTLLDTARDIMQACNYTLEKFGFSKLDESILRTKITAGMREMMKLSVPKDKWDSAGVETVMRDCFANYYTEHINDRTVPFDGINELMAKLENKGIKTAVITNKYEAMAKKLLSKYDFSKNLTLVLGCDSLSHSKPHPEPILKTLEKMGLSSDQAVYIGDHKNDITASNAANTDSIAALWGYGTNECDDVSNWGATYIAKDVKDIFSIIFC